VGPTLISLIDAIAPTVAARIATVRLTNVLRGCEGQNSARRVTSEYATINA
jgi:hypothetical protein